MRGQQEESKFNGKMQEWNILFHRITTLRYSKKYIWSNTQMNLCYYATPRYRASVRLSCEVTILLLLLKLLQS